MENGDGCKMEMVGRISDRIDGLGEVAFVIWTEQSIIFCGRDSTKGDGKW